MEFDINRLDFLNVDMGLSNCGNDEEILCVVIETFVEEFSGNEIQELFESKNWTDYEIKVHALKSSSLTIGAEELSALAKAQEFAVKEGRIDDAVTNHPAFMVKYRELMEKLNALCD